MKIAYALMITVGGLVALPTAASAQVLVDPTPTTGGYYWDNRIDYPNTLDHGYFDHGDDYHYDDAYDRVNAYRFWNGRHQPFLRRHGARDRYEQYLRHRRYHYDNDPDELLDFDNRYPRYYGFGLSF